MEIEITKFQKSGYRPLVDYDSWRVAVLKFCDDLRPEQIQTMQRHMETDEVFVLLRGSCTLFLGGSEEKPEQIRCVTMQQGYAYNIKKRVWHNHCMDSDGEVLIVENRNTSDENSPIELLNDKQKREILQFAIR